MKIKDDRLQKIFKFYSMFSLDTVDYFHAYLNVTRLR